MASGYAGLSFQALSGQPFGFRDVTAAGTGQSTAKALANYSGIYYAVSGADGTKGVVLPSANKGFYVIVKNLEGATGACPIYPALADTINGGSANAAYTLAIGSTVLLIGRNATDWATISSSGGSGSGTTGAAITITDPVTPSLTTQAGSTNTGFVQINGKTSGALKITTADATGFTITITDATQTVGNTTLTIPNFAGVSDTFAFTTLAQTLQNKVLDSTDTVKTGAATSGNFDTAGGLTDISNATSGTTQNTEYTLNSITIKANSFNANTRGLQVTCWGTLAANANAKNVKIYFGGTAVATVTGSTGNGVNYYATLDVVRLNSNSQSAVGTIQIDTGTNATMAASATITETDTADIIIALKTANTAAAATSGTGKGMIASFIN